MTTTNSLAGGNAKAPFYHMAHPYKAYTDGYNAYLGNMNAGRETFDAYNYYLPMGAVRLIPRLNDYFQTLINDGPQHPDQQRRRSFLASIDAALSVLCRIKHLNENGDMAVLGSSHLKPITWAVVGKGEPPCRLYKFQFHSLYSMLEHYVRRYDESCHAHPVCVYQQSGASGGRATLEALVAGMKDRPANVNVFLAGAIHFMVDFLEHAGPDCTDFFDLFTNDLSAGPATVDIALWRKARDKALYADEVVRETPQQRQALYQAGSFVSPPAPPPKPTRVKVTITDEGDDLSKGTKVTKFQAIVITPPHTNYYAEYYY